MENVPGFIPGIGGNGAQHIATLLGQQYNNVQRYGQQAQQTANRLRTDFSQFNPALSTNFAQLGAGLQRAELGADLDAASQRQLGQMAQQRQAALQQQQAETARSLDPRLAAVLNQQAAARAGLGANADRAAVQQSQDQRVLQQQGADIARIQQLAGLQQQGNQAALQQAEIGANLQGLGNQATLQRLQALGLPLQAQQGLLGAATSFAELFAPRETKQTGGLLGLLGII
jgi:hypothetical protein